VTPDLAAGLTDLDIERALVVKWPHLRRAGRQPWNQIADSFEEQFARAKAGRQPEPLDEVSARRLVATVAEFPDLFGPALMNLLAPDLGELVAEVTVGD
jgi:hypothetical protein